ncbi:DUF3265 domain-containing protein [Vibrio vulnificus]|nr:DUF3265 domain-containing protein [Vibrio vulnificus]
MNFGGESGLRKLGLCGIHPLTQRYVALFMSEKTPYKIQIVPRLART